MSVSAAVFASGGGTNLQALLDHEEREGEGAAYRVSLVVSDRQGVGALERAARAGRGARVVPVSGRSLDEVGRETLALLKEHGVELILLAGYLRLIPEEIVRAFRRRILNIHPALLPAFGGKGMYGKHVHAAVLESGARLSGVTVHYVDEEYDHGTILAQWPVPVQAGDTPESLAARVLQVEHALYPLAAEHLARAVERGEQPRPFSAPPDAFGLGKGTDADLRAHIRRGFKAPAST